MIKYKKQENVLDFLKGCGLIINSESEWKKLWRFLKKYTNIKNYYKFNAETMKGNMYVLYEDKLYLNEYDHDLTRFHINQLCLSYDEQEDKQQKDINEKNDSDLWDLWVDDCFHDTVKTKYLLEENHMIYFIK